MPFATTTGGMFEAYRIAGVMLRHVQGAPYRFRSRVVLMVGLGKSDEGIVAWNRWNAELPGQSDGGVFVPNGAQRRRRWTDEAQAFRFDPRGKIGILRQKAIARIDGVKMRALWPGV